MVQDADGDTPELLNSHEAGRILGVNPRTVRRWSLAGEIECVIENGRRYYLRVDVETKCRELENKKGDADAP